MIDTFIEFFKDVPLVLRGEIKCGGKAFIS
jgi:hypothetical protein